MLDILARTFDLFGKNGLCYVHFKSNEHLDEALEGKTDLDILVKREQESILEKILLQLDYRRAVSQKSMVYPGVDDWIGFDRDTGSLVHIHLHYHLITGQKFVKEYELPWGRLALETAIPAQQDSRIRIACTEFEILLLMTRCDLKSTFRQKIKKQLGQSWFDAGSEKEFNYLVRNIDGDKLRQMCRSFFSQADEATIESITSCLISGLHQGKSSALFHQLLKKELKNLKSGTWIGNKARSTCRVINYFFVKLQKRKLKRWWRVIKKSPHNGGLAIAFIGSDGSGKSTVSKDIRKWLAWKYDCESIYLGSGDGHFDIYKGIRSTAAKLIKKIKGRSKGGTSREELHEIRENIEKKPLISLIEYRHNIRFARRINKKIMQMNQYRMQGGIAILDRYPQTQFDGINDGVKTNSRYQAAYQKERSLLSVADRIQPDLVIKLHVPLDVAIQRKPLEREETIEKKIGIVDQLKFSCPVVKIDTTQDYNEELKAVKSFIWEHL